ncbi:MAG: ABC transporter permease [Candidatus Melainabacteria bacterium]|nr:ABC transporter permease [Candidatus Melainabacteria bacterium]
MNLLSHPTLSATLPKLHRLHGLWPIALKTLRQESNGWPLELLATIASPVTFFLAFGLGLTGYMHQVEGHPYIVFLLPGLVANTVVMQAYNVGAWSLWLDRWHQGMTDEYRIKPVSTTAIIMGQIVGGCLVALVKGVIVALVLLCLVPTHLSVEAMVLFAVYLLPATVALNALGAMAGTAFRKPDHIAQSLTIVITPLLYLGGLFFPMSSYPEHIRPWVNWLPTTMLFEGSRQSLLEGHFPWLSFSILCLWALLCLLVAVRTYNRLLSE